MLFLIPIKQIIMNFSNSKVLIRVDFNVPLDGSFQITDDTRIGAAIPTLKQLLSKNNALIIMSHLGRPQKKKNEDGSINVKKFTLEHVVSRLTTLLGTTVQFAYDTVGKDAIEKADALQAGEILLLENTRFHSEEATGDEAFAKQLAKMGDVYVNDAFGTAHRAHASTATIAQFFPKDKKAFGLLMKRELENAEKVVKSPSRPFTAIVGGAKVSDKIMLIKQLLEKVDNIIIGGGMAYTFMKAKGGSIGTSLVELDKIILANELIELAKEKNVNFYLPEDSIIADSFNKDAKTKTSKSDDIEESWMGLDIGDKARNQFAGVIESSKTILWNGPMGVFEMEPFAGGTRAVAHAVAYATSKGAFSLIGGGDSVAAINQSGLEEQVSFISTGGGAMLEYLEGKELPGVAGITNG
jgi:phosphoglycerate kinase